MNGAPGVVNGAHLKCGLARVMVVVFVCVTAAVSLAWSHTKLLSQDEMYEFQTDSVPSLAELVHVQRTWPISLDPLLYHALSHGAMRVFGAGAFAQRLPALAGFLLMQVCLFFFVRNLAGERAGAVAAAFPAVTATLFYAVEGRPYGLMLGLYALALWCWQVAERQGTGDRQTGNRCAGVGAGGAGGGDGGDDQCALLRDSSAGSGVRGRGVENAGAETDRASVRLGDVHGNCGRDGGAADDAAVSEGGRASFARTITTAGRWGCTILRGRTGRSSSTTRR